MACLIIAVGAQHHAGQWTGHAGAQSHGAEDDGEWHGEGLLESQDHENPDNGQQNAGHNVIPQGHPGVPLGIHNNNNGQWQQQQQLPYAQVPQAAPIHYQHQLPAAAIHSVPAGVPYNNGQWQNQQNAYQQSHVAPIYNNNGQWNGHPNAIPIHEKTDDGQWNGDQNSAGHGNNEDGQWHGEGLLESQDHQNNNQNGGNDGSYNNHGAGQQQHW